MFGNNEELKRLHDKVHLLEIKLRLMEDRHNSLEGSLLKLAIRHEALLDYLDLRGVDLPERYEIVKMPKRKKK